MTVRRVACAGGIVHDTAGRILLIRRGTPPSQGTWSVPGGRCRDDETSATACVREVGEETGLSVETVRLAGTVERAGPGGVVYVIDDWVCHAVGGTLRAGDDADDARWVSAAELADLELAPLLGETLARWSLLPR